MVSAAQELVAVPRLWPGETVIVIASGPSLTREDVEFCRGRARVIAVKDAIKLAPWADAAYFCGSDVGRWWQFNKVLLEQFQGLKYTLDPAAANLGTVLRNLGEIGLSTDPTGLMTGRNSGAQAIGLALHLGAAKVVLLGYDMKTGPNGQSHFCGEHPYVSPLPLQHFMPFFDAIAVAARALGVEIVNATPDSALTCFPMGSLASEFGEDGDWIGRTATGKGVRLMSVSDRKW